VTADRGGRGLPDFRHRRIAVDAHRLPAPFRSFAVRSDEACHAHAARAPCAQVHVMKLPALDASALASLAAEGLARVDIPAFSDIDYANTTPQALAAAAPSVADLVGEIAQGLRRSGVLGENLGDYRHAVAARIDFLAARGAGFHNDVARHWSRSLFWLLTLAATDVEFVLAHAGVRLPLAPGDLIVFDQALAHGLCRPADDGQAVAASFGADESACQVFLTGELLLTDAQWAAVGAPWQPVEWHRGRGALDLLVAEFDDRTGAIQRPGSLRDGMSRDTCRVDSTAGCDDA